MQSSLARLMSTNGRIRTGSFGGSSTPGLISKIEPGDFSEPGVPKVAAIENRNMAVKIESGPGLKRSEIELTRREAEILECIAQGPSSQEVADLLFLSKRTVDFHLANIYKRLQVGNRIQAIRAAQRLGLVPPVPTMSTTFDFPGHRELEHLSSYPEQREASRQRRDICSMQEGIHDNS